MNLHCLTDQQDLFEMSVLSQTVEIVPITAEAVIEGGLQFPLVIVGRWLTIERVMELKRLVRAIHDGLHPLFLFPPYVQRELEVYLDLPVPLALVRQNPELVTVVDGILTEMLQRDTVRIRVDDGLNSSLRAGVMARVQDGLPVLLRHQPKNTQAPIIIATLHLLTYSALSDELDRQGMLEALLNYPYAIARREVPDERQRVGGERVQVPAESLKAVVAALAAVPRQSVRGLLAMLSQRLSYTIETEHLEAALSELSRHGVIQTEAGQVQADVDTMTRLVDEWGLRAYVRELLEMSVSE